MSIKYLLVAVSLVVILANCSQDVPFVAGGYGFSVGDLHGTLQIQFFVDFQCPDSKDSWNTWNNVRKSISLLENRVKLTYQFMPLPYHFYAIYIHEAFFYIWKKVGTSAAEDYITYVFLHQDDFVEKNYLNKTAAQFAQQFSLKIAPLFGIDAVELQKEFLIGSDSFKTMMGHWRYTTIQNGVAGTPIFYANGIRVDGAQNWSYLDWINFIKEFKS